jgi:hypothetical protein
MLEFLEKNLVAANPMAFLAFVIAFAVGGFMWTMALTYYSGQVATAEGDATLTGKQRDDFTSKLSVSTPDEAKSKVDRFEGELHERGDVPSDLEPGLRERS